MVQLESGDDWSYQAGLKYGWIPRNPAEKKYVREDGFFDSAFSVG